jgi:hypothetical protein
MNEKILIQDVLDNFPDMSIFFVLLDWLEDNGKEDLADLCRNGGGGYYSNDFYFYGNSFWIKARGPRIAIEEIYFNNITDPILYRHFIILIARFIHEAASDRNVHGISVRMYNLGVSAKNVKFRAEQKIISERLKNKEESNLRWALSDFLKHFEWLERNIFHRNRVKRPPWWLDDQIESALKFIDDGFHITKRVIERCLVKHFSQFLQNLVQRIETVLDGLPPIDDFYNLINLNDYIRTHNK